MTREDAQAGERCPERVIRADGSWLRCDRPKGHGVDSRGRGCSVYWAGVEPTWNPRDTERRKGDRRAP